MRFKTKPIELEAVKYDGDSIPDFAQDHISATDSADAVLVDTHEGQRTCSIGDYFVLTDAGQLLVRNGGVFEAVFEPKTD